MIDSAATFSAVRCDSLTKLSLPALCLDTGKQVFSVSPLSQRCGIDREIDRGDAGKETNCRAVQRKEALSGREASLAAVLFFVTQPLPQIWRNKWSSNRRDTET